MPPARSEISSTGGPVRCSEARDAPRGRSRVLPSRRVKPMPAAREGRLDEVEERGPLGEHERLVAVGDGGVEALEKRLELGGARGLATRQEPG